jgi:hypothetical protein
VDDRDLTRDEVRLVLRRAAELERGAGDDAADTLSEAELERLGAEVGLSPHAVRQAIAEARAGAMDPAGAPAPLERVLGRRLRVHERVVGGEVVRVRARVEQFLRGQLFRLRRRVGERQRWERTPGLVPELRRSLNWTGRYALTELRTVEVLVLEGPAPGRARVRLIVDVAPLQERMAGGSALGTIAGAALAGVLWVTGTPQVFEWLVAASGAGIGVLASWREYRRGLTSVSAALEHFLDELEHAGTGGPPPPSPFPWSWPAPWPWR